MGPSVSELHRPADGGKSTRLVIPVSTAMARPLFGGAISAVIPHSAQDVSELRQIPDNQEVFAHSQTDQSIIIELLEYQSQVQDADAARYHFEDVAASNKAVENGSWEVRGVEQVLQSELSMQECSSAWLLSGAQLISKFNEEAKNTVNIHLCLFRLPLYTTDILVTFNDPVCINPLSSSAVENGAAIPWTLQDFKGVLQSFCLLDPGVFGSFYSYASTMTEEKNTKLTG
ncbi:hypothetical protein G5714_006175 [Onychostoma macrolepis]|uniref:Ran guanine nucleotide release factor n=3 Tax=Onychostoma macrolepis TaxID=369639 RepID=A0A7J6D336_9TELE|nr:hypothetical protein G5714_006175 [Onychostoma macrolepis]